MKIKAMILRDFHALVPKILLALLFYFFIFCMFSTGTITPFLFCLTFHFAIFFSVFLFFSVSAEMYPKFYQSLPVKKKFFNEVFWAGAGEYLLVFFFHLLLFSLPIYRGDMPISFLVADFLYYALFFITLSHGKKISKKMDNFSSVIWFATLLLSYHYPQSMMNILFLSAGVLLLWDGLLFFVGRKSFPRRKTQGVKKIHSPLLILLKYLSEPFGISFLASLPICFPFFNSLFRSQLFTPASCVTPAMYVFFCTSLLYDHRNWKLLLSLPLSPRNLVLLSEGIRLFFSSFLLVLVWIGCSLWNEEFIHFSRYYVMGIASGMLWAECWLYFLFLCDKNLSRTGRYLIGVISFLLFSYCMSYSNFPLLLSLIFLVGSLLTTPIVLYYQLRHLGLIIPPITDDAHLTENE